MAKLTRSDHNLRFFLLMSSALDTVPTFEYFPDRAEIVCQGNWTVHCIEKIEAKLTALTAQVTQSTTINLKALSAVDSAGAVLLYELVSALEKQGKSATFIHASDKCSALLGLIAAQYNSTTITVKKYRLPNFLYIIGQQTMHKLEEVLSFLSFIGLFAECVVNLIQNFRQPSWKSVFVAIEDVGYKALPIVGLLTFLVGVVVTFQIAIQLETYGANIYIADLSGIIIFREFGPLITAIIAAGRTSTSFTAQIGTMKVNEELDALKTMGVSPIERLVFPKVVALLIALPFLTVWADLFGVVGSMLMADTKLDISPLAFLERFQYAVPVRHFFLGLVKVPVFSLIIALVGCFQGFRVAHSADDIGRKTTKSAVQSIFLIIIADALFSVFFSLRGL